MEQEVIVTDKNLPEEVLSAIENGRKIEAIKLLRKATGLGLANAKVLVDRASSRYAERHPSSAITESDGGAATLLKMLLAVTLIFAVYRFFIGG